MVSSMAMRLLSQSGAIIFPKGSDKLKKVLNTILNVDKLIGPLLVLALMVDVILQIMSRLIPGNSFPWTVELGEMMLGATIWLGISVAVLEGAHVGFDIITEHLPEKMKKPFTFVSNLLFIAYLVLLGIFTLELMQHYQKVHSTSTILGISMYYVRMPILIGCVMSVIRLLIKQVELITGKTISPAGKVAKGDYE